MKPLSKESFIDCLICGYRAKLYRGRFFQCKKKNVHTGLGSIHPKFTRVVSRCKRINDLKWEPLDKKMGVDVKIEIAPLNEGLPDVVESDFWTEKETDSEDSESF